MKRWDTRYKFVSLTVVVLQIQLSLSFMKKKSIYFIVNVKRTESISNLRIFFFIFPVMFWVESSNTTLGKEKNNRLFEQIKKNCQSGKLNKWKRGPLISAKCKSVDFEQIFALSKKGNLLEIHHMQTHPCLTSKLNKFKAYHFKRKFKKKKDHIWSDPYS